MTRWVVAAVVIHFSQRAGGGPMIALSPDGPWHASAQSYHISKQLTRPLVRCNTERIPALIQHKDIPAVFAEQGP